MLFFGVDSQVAQGFKGINMFVRGLGLYLGIFLVGCSFNTSGAVLSERDDATTGPVDGSVTPDGAAGDSDGDGVPDGEDNCKYQPNPGQEDGDGDGVGDLCDNCQAVANPLQENQDSDAMGDACDGDRDGDQVPNDRDPRPTVPDQVYYFDELDVSQEHFYVQEGDWAFDGAGALCQAASEATTTRARLNDTQMTVTNYLAETLVHVGDHYTGDQGVPEAGLAFRVSDVAAYNFAGYVCAVNPRDRSLDFISFSSSNWDWIEYSANDTIPAAGPYHLRITAAGNNITCELLPDGPLLIAPNHTDNPTGTVGFFTNRAAACWDYLVVTEP